MSSRLLEIQTRIYNLLANWLPEGSNSGAEPSAPAQNILENQNRMYDLLSARFAQMPDEIADAVLLYLEDHPEALNQAAVEAILDGKLDGIEEDVGVLKSAIHYVTPQQFGAKGDGVTDDTLALKDCIDYAMANNYVVHLPMGTYIVDSGEMVFDIADGQSLIVVGDGQNTLIKRKSDTVTTKWQRVFGVRIHAVNAPAHDVIFCNFGIDSNRRGQQTEHGGIPENSYDYEACADIGVWNDASITDASTQYLEKFVVKDMRFCDPVADCVNVSGSGLINIRDVIIDGVIATDRSGTRNDIGFTASPLHNVWITNCVTGTIHFEFNGTVSDENVIPFFINKCRFGVCTLGGKFNLYMDNCVTDDAFSLNDFNYAKLTNCVIPSNGTSYNLLSSTGECWIDGCEITTVVNPNNASNYVFPFYIRNCKKVTMTNCDFAFIGELTEDYDNDTVNDHAAGYAVQVEGSLKFPILIDNCRFDDCFQFAFRYNDNNITIKNIEFGTYSICIGGSVSSTGEGMLTFVNVKTKASCKYLFFAQNIKNSININGEIYTDYNSFSMTTQTGISDMMTWVERMTGDFRRIVRITNPLDLTEIRSVAGWGKNKLAFLLYRGDTFIYDGADRQKYPEKWVVKNTEYTAYNNNYVLTTGTDLKERCVAYGTGYGETADRPTCYISPGFEFFDTTLGKKIVWNGTAWVNCDGTAL